MRSIALIAGTVLLATAVAFAGDIIITLHPETGAVGQADFYIKGLIDGRNDTANIGFGLTGIFNNRNSAYLSPDFRTGILQYMNAEVPYDSTKSPVTVKLMVFRVSETSGFSGEYGMFEVKMNFYAAGDSGLAYLYTTEDYVKESGLDVTSGHNRRIATGLNKCLIDFIHWRSHPDSAVARSDTGHTVPALDTVSRRVIPTKQYDARSIVALAGYYGANSRSGGLEYSRYVIKGAWYPASSFGMLIRKLDYTSSTGRYTGSFMDLYLSAGAIRVFTNHRAGLRLLGSIPFGFERIKYPDGTTSDSRFFIGIDLNQSIVTLPWKAGVSFAIGPFERVLFNSKAYPWDAGIAARAGVQF